jgi:dTMP kinase
MTAEAELLLMNASRAQLVREVIRPALETGEIVVCDRFYDSTIAYQGYGRELDLKMVQTIIDVAVGDTRPNLTLLLTVSPEISELRRAMRQSTLPFMRDRIEEADQQFFQRVDRGFAAIAAAEPNRFCLVEASGTVESVSDRVWNLVRPVLPKIGRW